MKPKINARVGLFEKRIRGYNTLLKDHDGFENPRQSAAGFEMADVAFHGASMHYIRLLSLLHLPELTHT